MLAMQCVKQYQIDILFPPPLRSYERKASAHVFHCRVCRKVFSFDSPVQARQGSQKLNDRNNECGCSRFITFQE